MKYAVLLSCALSIGLPGLASAAPAVYPGCTVPSLKAGHHTFFVDPVKGSAQGDGSAAKPWRTLSEVLNPPSKLVATQVYVDRRGTGPMKDWNSSGPIKAGDVIMLMNGNHGDVFVQGAFNKEFITVMGAPGQAPVLNSLRVQNGQNWLFQGLNIIPDLNTINAVGIVMFPYGDWAGTSNNLILDNSVVATVADASKWSSADWMSKPKSVGIGLAGVCMSITNTHVRNVVNGIGIGSNKALVQGNTIEQMLNDGIDVSSSNVTIKGNSIKNGANIPESSLHADGIQGWSPVIKGVTQVVSNVTIDSNTITKFGSGAKSYMQGISIFDGKWNNLSVTNNSVAVNTWNGIILSAPANSWVINNTVYGTDAAARARLTVGEGKDKSVPVNTVVRNNIGQDIRVVGTRMTFDHNIADALITTSNQTIKNGTIGNANSVRPTLAAGFVSLAEDESKFDLRLRSNSPAIAAGNSQDAPQVDISGKKRSSPVDGGAYTH